MAEPIDSWSFALSTCSLHCSQQHVTQYRSQFKVRSVENQHCNTEAPIHSSQGAQQKQAEPRFADNYGQPWQSDGPSRAWGDSTGGCCHDAHGNCHVRSWLPQHLQLCWGHVRQALCAHCKACCRVLTQCEYGYVVHCTKYMAFSSDLTCKQSKHHGLSCNESTSHCPYLACNTSAICSVSLASSASNTSVGLAAQRSTYLCLVTSTCKKYPLLLGCCSCTSARRPVHSLGQDYMPMQGLGLRAEADEWVGHRGGGALRSLV